MCPFHEIMGQRLQYIPKIVIQWHAENISFFSDDLECTVIIRCCIYYILRPQFLNYKPINMDISLKIALKSMRNVRGSKNSSPYRPDLHTAPDLDSQVRRPSAFIKINNSLGSGHLLIDLGTNNIHLSV